jgi:CheY-like chemotaxis protein
VLVIEDDPGIRDYLSILLEMEGCGVACAAHGLDALAWLEANRRPSVVLLDLEMPVMDGFALRSRMLRDARLAAIPVILVSARALTPEEISSLRPAAVLLKPFEPDRLLERIAGVCRPQSPRLSNG